MTASTALKERPILFSAPMVRALLDGSKTQTRRAVKHKWPYLWEEPCYPTGKVLADLPTQSGAWMEFRRREQDAVGYEGSPASTLVLCPYGKLGDRLWVREAFAVETTQDYEGDPGIAPALGPVKWEDDGGYRLIPRYRASEPGTLLMIAPSEKDEIGMRWKPSIHMPRWASRILLEVTDVRVERLQDISEADALAEGIVRQPYGGYGLADTTHYHSADPRMSYGSLWEAINGPGSVETNPWIWVVSFTRVFPIAPGEQVGRAA